MQAMFATNKVSFQQSCKDSMTSIPEFGKVVCIVRCARNDYAPLRRLVSGSLCRHDLYARVRRLLTDKATDVFRSALIYVASSFSNKKTIISFLFIMQPHALLIRLIRKERVARPEDGRCVCYFVMEAVALNGYVLWKVGN